MIERRRAVCRRSRAVILEPSSSQWIAWIWRIAYRAVDAVLLQPLSLTSQIHYVRSPRISGRRKLRRGASAGTFYPLVGGGNERSLLDTDREWPYIVSCAKVANLSKMPANTHNESIIVVYNLMVNESFGVVYVDTQARTNISFVCHYPLEI